MLKIKSMIIEENKGMIILQLYEKLDQTYVPKRGEVNYVQKIQE